jgi:hypothetical protein
VWAVYVGATKRPAGCGPSQVCKADAAVKANDFTVEVSIVNDCAAQMREFIRRSEPLWADNLREEVLLHLWWCVVVACGGGERWWYVCVCVCVCVCVVVVVVGGQLSAQQSRVSTQRCGAAVTQTRRCRHGQRQRASEWD